MKWTRRFRERRRDIPPGERVSWLGFILSMLLLAGFAYLVAYPYLKEPPFVERDFVGRVVDKSLTLRETDLGSRPSMRLLVEDRAGLRFKVRVVGEFYERARVGMWVSRRRGELKLHPGEPDPVAPGGDGTRIEAR